MATTSTQRTIESGDSLNKLADEEGTDWRTLADLNGVTPFLPLPVGELLSLPSTSSVTTLADAALQEIQKIDWLY